MKLDLLALQNMQRLAYEMLSSANPSEQGSLFKARPVNIHTQATIRQELPWVNTGNPFVFKFGTDAPDPNFVVAPNLNNRLLGENNSFAAYGIRILFGEGSAAANRVYRSENVTVPDGSLYNGKYSIKIESNTPVDLSDTLDFREEGDFMQYSGMVLINPLRLLTGRIATLNVIVNLPDITTLTLTSNTVVLCELVGAVGLA